MGRQAELAVTTETKWDAYANSIPMVYHWRQFIRRVEVDETYWQLLQEWGQLGTPDDWHELPIGTFGITEEIATLFGMQCIKRVKGWSFHFSELDRASQAIAGEYQSLGMQFLETHDQPQNL